MSYYSDEESSSSEDPETDFKFSLLTFIEGIKAAGSFSTFNVADNFVLPGLHVTGVGDISLPISEDNACRMIAESKQAPFGRGDETVVDVSVRRTWELESIEFRNPEWQGFLEGLLSKVRDDLGVASPIKAEFYKLLIYEKGAMFKSHRDTERLPGMFGTLVICLPSSHQGGELELRHGEKVVQYQTDKKSAFAMSYLAWYSDVAHEIHPVSAGYRIVLTYNLTAESRLISASEHDKTRNVFKKILEPWQEFNNAFLMFKLDHQYTSDSLSKGFLKGSDEKKARFLDSYYKKDDQIIPLLARMELHAEHYDEEGDEVDEELIVYDIMHLDGIRLTFDGESTLRVPQSCVLQGNIWCNREPDKQYGGGYMGNEHAAVQKQYHNTVLILVKLSGFSEFLLGSHARSLRMEQYIGMLSRLLSIESKRDLADSQLLKIYNKTLSLDDSFKGVAACCALYKQRTDWFTTVVGALKSCFSEHSYRMLGRLIDVDNPVVDLDELSSTFTRSASVYDAWTNSRAFISGTKAVRLSINLLSFTQSIMFEALKSASKASSKDGKVIKEILSELEGEKKAWKSFMLNAVKCFLERHAGNESFVTQFFLENYTVQSPVTKDLVISMLQAVCQLLKFETFILYRSTRLDALEKLLSMVQNHSQNLAPILLSKILSQAAGLHNETLLDMLVMLLKHDAAPTEFCQSLATLFLTKAVGKELPMPTDWTRSEAEANFVHCYEYRESCQECQAIKQFLLDPDLEKQVFNKDNVTHGRCGNSYLKIVKQGESDWLITKTDKYWKQKHATWSEKLEKFREKIGRLGEDVLASKLGAEKDNILRGECILYKPEDVRESDSPPAKRIKVKA